MGVARSQAAGKPVEGLATDDGFCRIPVSDSRSRSRSRSRCRRGLIGIGIEFLDEDIVVGVGEGVEAFLFFLETSEEVEEGCGCGIGDGDDERGRGHGWTGDLHYFGHHSRLPGREVGPCARGLVLAHEGGGGLGVARVEDCEGGFGELGHVDGVRRFEGFGGAEMGGFCEAEDLVGCAVVDGGACWTGGGG